MCSTICVFQQQAAIISNTIIKLYWCVPDDGRLPLKYTDCTTHNGFALYIICCGVLLLLPITHIYVCVSDRLN